MTSYPDISSIPIVGGNLALDLANTTSERHGPAPRERLHGPGDVVTWAERVGLAGRQDAAMLRKEAAAHPGRAARAVDRLLALREVTYRLFSSVAAGTDPDPADLAALDRAWHDSAKRRRLVWSAGGIGWRREGEDGLADLLWPVADSAVDLLASGELARVKECRGEDCNWLFVDSSRNRSRRWCDMADCGNRAKVRRYYRKQRGG